MNTSKKAQAQAQDLINFLVRTGLENLVPYHCVVDSCSLNDAGDFIWKALTYADVEYSSDGFLMLDTATREQAHTYHNMLFEDREFFDYACSIFKSQTGKIYNAK